MQDHFYHIPALLDEVKKHLNPRLGAKFIDCTAGGGGHLVALAEAVGSEGKVLGIDVDPDALEEIQKKIESRNLKERVILKNGNFKDIEEIARASDFLDASGILFDLGVSSFQLNEKEKGFGFGARSLDMRMDPNAELTAADILNTYGSGSLKKIFQDYGEEPLSKIIAREVVKKRSSKKFYEPRELVLLVENIYRKIYRKRSRRNPAAKVFQALRIAVNHELENLMMGLRGAVKILKTGGRLAVISYHSLEDRIVKRFFKIESRDCICESGLPECMCGHSAQLKIITKKLVVPSFLEVKTNPRSRSARLRVAEKI